MSLPLPVAARLRLALAAGCCVLALGSSAPAAAADARPPLKLGLLLPPAEADAQSLYQGARLGAERASRELGVPVELDVRGSAGQWGTEGDDAVALALDQGAQALIAPTSGAAAHQALQVAGRTRIPVVSLCGDSSVTGAGIPWAVRIAPRTDEEAGALLAALATPGKPLRVVAFVPEGRAGREATNDLQTAITKAKLELAQTIEVPAEGMAAGNLVRPALAARPDLVLLWCDAALSGRLARALRDAGFAGRLAGHGRVATRAFTATAGKAADGLVFAVPAEADGTANATFRRELGERFPVTGGTPVSAATTNVPPDLNAALSFDAVRLLAEVLNNAGGRPAFREFPLRELRPGVTGDLAFDASGNRKLRLEVREFRDGAPRPFKLSGPSQTGAAPGGSAPR